MLELTDPRWTGLQGNYNPGTRTAELLGKAYAGESPEEWYDDLFQECCHQYTVSEVAYAAAPHLVKIAALGHAPKADVLILLGTCHAFANQPISSKFEQEWYASAQAAIPLTADLLARHSASEEELRNLFSALAAFKGFISLAKALEAFDVDPGLGIN